jgi:4-amino-4-deoxy-L-arabinose transferase-like glycosyltransferase
MNKPIHLFLLISLIAISAIVYLIGNGRVALWDRDEPRYAETSRQMLQSGDWVVPHYLDKPRTAKPALIYWCQAAAMKIFGDNEFAARFPSAIGTTLLLIVMGFVLWRPLGSQMTLWTVFIFATSGLTIAAAKMCITDAVLLLFVTIGQLCIYAMWRGNRSWGVVILLSCMIGLAGLTKGPVILGIEITTLMALSAINLLNRKYPPAFLGQSIAPPVKDKLDAVESIARIVVGALIVLLFVLPWVMMVNHRASGFILTGLKHDVWDRMMTPLEQHVGPPGYYFLTVWLTFFPWSLLLPLAIGVGIRRRADPRTRFALAAILGPWIMLECVKTKLPHYFLPVFPPLAFLTADALIRSIRGEIQDLKSKAFIIPAGIWAVVIALVASGPWLVVHAFSPMPIHAMIALSVFGIVFGFSVFIAFNARRIAAAATIMGLGTFVLIGLMYLWYLPDAQFLRLSDRVAAVLIQNHVTQPNQVIMMEYMEPSLAFAQGGTIREAGPVGFSLAALPRIPEWLVLNKTIWDKAPLDLRKQFVVIDQVFGLAYADHGRWTTVMILRKKIS